MRKSKTDVSGQPMEFKKRPFQTGIVAGGLLFGVGWYFTAACPGPIYALIGTGTWTAFAILAGALVGAFLLLAWRGITASMRAPDTYGALVAGGITAWISVQAFINIGAVTNVLPTTGIPLPFISYGGSAMIVFFAAIGITASVNARSAR